jgi:HEPN domain-containing protein
MHNNALAHDYVIRAGKRQLAVEVLFGKSSWADVVRECQEIVELLLRALLKLCRIEVSRFQDVSVTLEIHKDRIPEPACNSLGALVQASKSLRRDRELAFYGSEDLTPSEFYSQSDAETAMAYARQTQAIVAASIKTTE